MYQPIQILEIKYGIPCGTIDNSHIADAYVSFLYHLHLAEVFADGIWPAEMIRHFVYAQRLAIFIINHSYSQPINSPSHSEHP